MCVRTYLLPPPQSQTKGQRSSQSPAKEKVPNDLPSVFQLGSDQQWHFRRAQKKGTLEPFKDFPAFLVEVQVAAGKGGSQLD